ncbi:haloacid dehalogenase type II [Kribbella solani]|uniref:haloacid dehalogenase type II n=1 Tax=Kribbella solani TaxID=236067 RepID=UPI0029A2880A|nr:haloacid dehalogenase type II [Kribbella solani]MDX2973167.1 haloacid dehalogenase type II [Kribbella solani]MDX3005714.1 haloacid dehalogenase type II [Kribbella solani]
MLDVLLLDVNETLTDLEPLRDDFEAAGLPRHTLDAWFAATLRDGLALTTAGAYADFPALARELLEAQLVAAGIEPTEERVTGVLSGFTRVPLHPDVAPGLRKVHAAGVRIVTLTNGRAAMSEGVFTAGGIMPLLEHRLDVSVPRRWKPHPDAYRYAAEVCGVPVERMGLAAVHPWDIDGARRAGLQGFYVDRRNTPYPKAFLPPDLIVPDFEALAVELAR